MDWLVITISAYFILAIVGIVDKFILGKVVPDYRIYAFFVGLLGMLVFVFAPYGLVWPGTLGFLFDIISGFFIIAALFLFYKSLKDGDASMVIPLIGGGIPLVVFILAYIFLRERLGIPEIIAFIFLIIGGIIISIIPRQKSFIDKVLRKKRKRGIYLALMATFFFALFFVLSKYLYNEQGFITAFIWARFGSFLTVLVLFFSPSFRSALRLFLRSFQEKKQYIMLANQFCGALGFIAQSYAVYLSSPVLVNALQGIQYVFILLLASLISVKWPHLIKEHITRQVIIQKSIAIVFIAIGLFIIARY